ncbi:MAG: hypothetical protein ACLRYY_11255 [Anaerobutyricum soehngenii]
MGKFMWKKAAAAAMTATILATSATVLQAAAPPDGHTNAQDTVEAYGGAYSNWMAKWNSTISKDREQISLSPGSDNSSVNFAWPTKRKLLEFRSSKIAWRIEEEALRTRKYV